VYKTKIRLSLYIAKNKNMHHTIVKSGIVTETIHDFVHSESSTSKHAKINTIVSAKTADDALYLSRVVHVCPTFTMKRSCIAGGN